MGCVTGKDKKNAGYTVAPYQPNSPIIAPNAPKITSKVVNTTTISQQGTPVPIQPLSVAKKVQVLTVPPPQSANGSNIHQPIPASSQPLNFTSRSFRQSATEPAPAPAPAPLVAAPLSISTNSNREVLPFASQAQSVNRQPVIVRHNEPIEICGGVPEESARNFQYVPVHVNPAAMHSYDTNSNYALQTTQIGGIQTFMDQKILELDMDSGSPVPTPKIYTYTYGNMMQQESPKGAAVY